MTYVYFISTKRQNVVKIGVANRPDKRLKTFQTAHYEELIILRVIKLPNRDSAFKLESALHRKFKRFHIRGEWFKLTATLRNFIENYQTEKISFLEEIIGYLEGILLVLGLLLFGIFFMKLS